MTKMVFFLLGSIFFAKFFFCQSIFVGQHIQQQRTQILAQCSYVGNQQVASNLLATVVRTNFASVLCLTQLSSVSHFFPTTSIKQKLYITSANIFNDLCVVISKAYHTRRRFSVTNDSVHYHPRSGFSLCDGYSCCGCVKQISLHMVAPLSIWLLPYIWLLHLAVVVSPSCMVAPRAIWLRLLTIWLRTLEHVY